jgi:diaminopimelate epimerase
MTLEKYHGLGNDFLVLLDLAGGLPVDAAAVRSLCDRRRGVGADGLIRVTSGDASAGTDVAMELWNADGSRAEMSGNGIRCLARAVLDAGLVTGPEVSVATDAGVRRVTADPAGSFSVDMGRVVVDGDQGQWGDIVEGPGPSSLVDVGNPHLVAIVDDPAKRDLAAQGRSVERFHGAVNVELVAAGPGPDELTMRVWERGVGETSSCGTGAVAAAAFAHDRHLVGDRVTVHQPGGDLRVDLDGESATLTGPAEHVCTVEVPCR